MKKYILISGFFLFLNSQNTHAQSYSIDWYKISGGGGGSTGDPYQLSGTVGQPDASGAMMGGNFSLTGGFWSVLSVVQTEGLPKLTITHSGNTIIISWPAPAGSYTLQQTGNLSAVGAWTTSALPIITANGISSIGITSPTGTLFFRLSSP